MARSVAWRRSASDTVSWRQDQALNTTIFILRNTGPTGFLLQEEGETKPFKVKLFKTLNLLKHSIIKIADSSSKLLKTYVYYNHMCNLMYGQGIIKSWPGA